MYRLSSPLRAELSAMYGPSCPLRAELSTGRVVHGPSYPGTKSLEFRILDLNSLSSEISLYSLFYQHDIAYNTSLTIRHNTLRKIRKHKVHLYSFSAVKRFFLMYTFVYLHMLTVLNTLYSVELNK